ncbi:MAG: GNAT family acetyltransferase [Proteobacteria bacterium]|nr:GNAT family acetyltransferase [Pseudomonadota bacterium]
MTTEQLEIRPYRESDESAVIQLWIDCNLVVPQNNPQNDIKLKMAFQPDLMLVGTIENDIVATAMVGYEGHRGWINYLAVSPSRQRLGLGRKMMEVAEQKLKEIGCPKLNIQVRTTNTGVIEFYKRIGFLDDNVIGLGKRF